ncbi:hypothetical protein [Caballeronia sordidicola]|uniref:hypothetical protein n=1 Tax=Caballeronia sordidicola TaxID=196367 RepID=UPI0004D03028|nr:hypothetical protein [Caballeronia sordidicola]
MISRQQPIIKATAFVSIFWWCLLTLWHAGWSLRDMVLHGATMGWEYSLAVIVSVATGIAAGSAVTTYSIWFDRRQVQKALKGRIERGVSITIGPIPIHLGELPRDDKSLSEHDVAAVREIREDGSTGFLTQWHAHFDARAPEHSRLMYALERVMAQHRALPATHVPGGHGGRNLLVHSLLVCWYMVKLAPSHNYNGTIKLPDFKITLKLKEPAYQFDGDDPLIALVGLAHDIGKIECYEYDDSGALIGCRRDHDLTGSRILARMPEFWDLPDDDRDTLSLVVGHYHHPQDMPTLDGFEVLSDRNHAMLELLIRADVLSSKREAGLNAAAAKGELGGESQFVETIEGKDLWKAVESVLTRVGTINGRTGSGNIGFKYRDPASGANLVYLVEKDFIDAVSAEARVTNTIQELRNDVSAVSKKVLMLFNDRGVLYTDRERSPSTALYNVQFFAAKSYWADRERKVPKSGEERGAPAFRLGSVIVIRADTLFPALGQLADFDKVPVIGKSRLGMGGVRKAGGADRTTIADLALGAELQPEVTDSTPVGDAGEEMPGGFDPLGAALQAQEAIRRAKESTAPSAPADGEVNSEANSDSGDGGTPWDDEETPWDEPDSGESSPGADPVPDSSESPSAPVDNEENVTQDGENSAPASADPAPAPTSGKQSLSPRTLSKAVRSMLWTGISKGELVHRELAADDDSPGNKVMCRTADVKAYMATRSKLSYTFEDMDEAIRQGVIDGVLVVGVCYQILRDAPRGGA